MTPPTGSCWHCGEMLPAGVVLNACIGGQSRAMCCHGCRAAAEWIEHLGLADYYRLRTEPAQKPSGEPNLDKRSHDAWQRPEIARHVVRNLGDTRRETMLLIDGVRCAACVWLIEQALGAAPGIVRVQVNAVSRRAHIVWDEAQIALPQILAQLSRTGYLGMPLDAQSLDDVRRRESRSALKRLLVAGFGAMQAMMYAAVLYLGALDAQDASTRELFRWLGFLAATPVVLYSARPFFSGALRSLKMRRPGMDVPVALAIALIYTASLIEALRGGGHVYFDSVSMFVFFLLAGRYLEMRARHRAGDLTDALARLTPPFADRVRADGTLERIGIHELCVGDCVQINEGGIVPADGALLSERCRVDEALLTGESSPLAKHRLDPLIAGSVLVDGPAQLRVERVGNDTALAGIATLVGRAQSERPRLAQLGELAATRFVARVLALTVLTVAFWSYFDSSRAFTAALAVLVISCPCAFALAVPAAITRALAVLAQRGVLIVRPDAIQVLADATHVVFDKTGTLTVPELALGDVVTAKDISRDSALRLAAALACHSGHPSARAIVAACDKTAIQFDLASDVNGQPGLGLSAKIDGREVRLGRADYALPRHDVNALENAVVLADAAGMIAAFQLKERLRPDARAAIDSLKMHGLHVAIASGDAASKVEDIAMRLGISDWRARQSPADKLSWLTSMRTAGARVIAVGDGVNDAPVLAGADVAVALAGGAELARASSDIVLIGERLEALAPARALAQQTLLILHQNHRWAMLYNLTAVPLAALGLINPWIAALSMSLSSLCVILNALRIGRDTSATRLTAPALDSTAPLVQRTGTA
jgi:P-type Cu2+ transporter